MQCNHTKSIHLNEEKGLYRSLMCRFSQSQRFLHRKHHGCRSSSCKHLLHACKETTNFYMLQRLDVTMPSLHTILFMLIWGIALQITLSCHISLPKIVVTIIIWHQNAGVCIYIDFMLQVLYLKMPWQKKTFIIQTCCDLIPPVFLGWENPMGFWPPPWEVLPKMCPWQFLNSSTPQRCEKYQNPLRGGVEDVTVDGSEIRNNHLGWLKPHK